MCRQNVEVEKTSSKVASGDKGSGGVKMEKVSATTPKDATTNVNETTTKPTTLKDIIKECIATMRPSLCLLYGLCYLYKNPNPHLGWLLYFTTVYPLAGMAGNDYIDWEHDRADPNRKQEASRGLATSKTRVWWYYMISTLITAYLGYRDPGFGLMYFVLVEILGQWLYNGIFCGIAMTPPMSLSFCKQWVGFPLDILANVYHFSFCNMAAGGQQGRSWVPSLDLLAIGCMILSYAQLKDYKHEKATGIRTTATVLGVHATQGIIVACSALLLYANPGFLPVCAFVPVRLLGGKMAQANKILNKIKLTLMFGINWLILTIIFLGSLLQEQIASLQIRISGEPPNMKDRITIEQAFASSDGDNSNNLWIQAAPQTDYQLLQMYIRMITVALAIRGLIVMYDTDAFQRIVNRKKDELLQEKTAS